jgi:hypothetical protein
MSWDVAYVGNPERLPSSPLRSTASTKQNIRDCVWGDSWTIYLLGCLSVRLIADRRAFRNLLTAME